MASRRTSTAASLLVTLSLCYSIASATVFFEERFDDEGWVKRWVVSDWKKAENASGMWNHTAGKWNGDPNDKGIQTSQDMKFYAISAEFPKFSNKNRTLVFQFSVKNEQKLHCGGGYLKLLSGDIDQQNFGEDTAYSVTFGPDICGFGTKKVHAILNYNGTYHENKKNVTAATDQLTHVYTFILRPNARYSILIDNQERLKGSLYKHWDLLPPKKIQDPDAKKPENCDDGAYIDDPVDKKPHAPSPGYDDIPMEIPDPDAEKKIKISNCEGDWKVPLIDNPEFKDDPDLYVYPDLKYVGIEVWQVKSGSLFDNILITDDPDYAKKLAEEIWGKHKDAEKAAFENFEKANKEKEVAEGLVNSNVDDETSIDKDADNKSDAKGEHHIDDKFDLDESKGSNVGSKRCLWNPGNFQWFQFWSFLIICIIL